VGKKAVHVKKTASTAILAVILAALLGYAYFCERGPVRKKTNVRHIPILKIKTGDIRSFEVSGAAFGYTLEKNGGVWLLDSSSNRRASKFSVSGLLSNIAGLEAERKIEGAVDAKEYGLDAPDYIFRIGMKNGATETILIGDKSDLGDVRYVERGGAGPIYVVPEASITPLLVPPGELADKSLADSFLREKVEAVSLSYKGAADVVCERTKPGWSVRGRPKSDCTEAADTLLSSLEFEEALRVLSATGDEAAKLGLYEPEYSVNIQVKGRPVLKMDVVSAGQGHCYVRNRARNEIYETAADFKDKMDLFRKAAAKI